MGKMEHTLLELLNMSVTAEKTFKKEGGNGTIAMFEQGSTSYAKPGNKDKHKFNANIKKKWSPNLKPKRGVMKKQKEGQETKGQCFYCGNDGHWKRN